VRVCDGEEEEIPACDALCTDVRGIGLLIRQADCQAVLLHDPQRRAVAALHVGWRGNAANLPGSAVARMALEFNTRPAHLRAVISPALGPCCGEFRGWQDLLPPNLHGYRLPGNFFDFQAITRDQLTAAGVKRESIEILQLCTVCTPNYFSHRAPAALPCPNRPAGSLIGLPLIGQR